VCDLSLFTLQTKHAQPPHGAFAVTSTTELLMRWASAVCARKGLKVTQLASSLADGSALVAIVSHYLPTLLSATPLGSTALSAADLFSSAARSLGEDI